MEHAHEAPPSGDTFVLTEDFIDKIEALRHSGINTMGFNSSFYPEIQDRLAAALRDALPAGTTLRRVKMHKLAGQVIGFIDTKWDEEDVLVVSTCPEFRYPSRGASIKVNRIVDAYGRDLTPKPEPSIGPRPGSPSLVRQLEKIERDARGRPIVLAEDGIFSGGTLDFILKAFEQAGLKVTGIVTGFDFREVRDPLHQEIMAEVVHDDISDLIDWVPDHDFLPFTPGCGKVLGSKVGGLIQPFYDHNGASFSLPYVAPFGDVHKWASIPKLNVETFSRECLAIARDVYVALDGLNQDRGRPLTVMDVVSNNSQRVSIPVRMLRESDDSQEAPQMELLPSEVGIVELLDSFLY